MSNVKMNEFLSKVKHSVISRQLIPMELGMGWPMLSIKNKKLCVTIPFYKAVVQREDKTLLYPIAYTITALWPSGVIVEFKNLVFDPKFKDIDFTRPVGTFRHEAVKTLNKAQYMEKRAKLFDYYDELISSLFSDDSFSESSEASFKELFGILIEPSLRPFYQVIDAQFYNRFLN